MAEKPKYFLKATINYMQKNLPLKKLRRYENGGELVCTYHVLMADSLPNNGFIYLEGDLEAFADDCFLMHGEDPDLVLQMIKAAEEVGLIEVQDDYLYFYQVEEFTKKEGGSTERSQKCRARKEQRKQEQKLAEELEAIKNEKCCNATVERCNSDFCNLERENTEVRINRYIREENREEKKTYSQSPLEIINLYNERCPSLSRAKPYPKLVNNISRILPKFCIEDLTRVFDFAEHSDFMQGKCNGAGHEDWQGAGIEFLIREDKIKGILAGKYKAYYSEPRAKIKNFADFEQRNINLDEMEAKLLSN